MSLNTLKVPKGANRGPQARRSWPGLRPRQDGRPRRQGPEGPLRQHALRGVRGRPDAAAAPPPEVRLQERPPRASARRSRSATSRGSSGVVDEAALRAAGLVRGQLRRRGGARRRRAHQQGHRQGGPGHRRGARRHREGGRHGGAGPGAGDHAPEGQGRQEGRRGRRRSRGEEGRSAWRAGSPTSSGSPSCGSGCSSRWGCWPSTGSASSSPRPGVDRMAMRRGRPAGQPARPLQLLLRRRARAALDLRARHHAVRLGLHHPAAPHGRGPGPREAAEGGRAGAAQDHPVHPLRHRRALGHPGLRHRHATWSRCATRRGAARWWPSRAGASGSSP